MGCYWQNPWSDVSFKQSVLQEADMIDVTTTFAYLRAISLLESKIEPLSEFELKRLEKMRKAIKEVEEAVADEKRRMQRAPR